ncbi:MAG: Cd(II)/Pb(II)-responsive transcriptional regulator [Candidatus Accumulibacter sp.]|jgi:Cd(II)/Pb(II)-responsive transcriptional regulator|nr:Cd(II)/Pb(II)-responsive transcriptional regulator [Accumulibacter sp.]
MKIGDMAKKAGCKVVTIRYYEKEGLLLEPERSDANYRSYGTEALDRLEFVLHCRKFGMKLDEIRALLSFRDHPQRDCTWVTELIDSHIGGVDAQIASLEHLKTHLEELRHRCEGGLVGNDCGIMRSLDAPEVCASCASSHASCAHKASTSGLAV